MSTKKEQLEKSPVPKDGLTQQQEYIASLQEAREANVELQNQHAASLGKDAQAIGFVSEARLVESMRNITFPNTAITLAELADNAIESGCHRISIAVNCEKGNTVSQIAIIDDGHGMSPEMLQEAVRFGGTHRHGSTSSLGRFGLGLDNSCINIGRQFTVFSHNKGAAWSAIDVDLDGIAKEATNAGGTITPPKPQTESDLPLPEWVRAYIEEQYGDLESGTVIYIDKIDHLTLFTKKGLLRHLCTELASIYRYYVNEIDFYVDTKKLQPCDPCFSIPGHYDPEFKKAYIKKVEQIEHELEFQITTEGDDPRTGWVRVRAVAMHPMFPYCFSDEAKKFKGHKLKSRWEQIQNNFGIRILRLGREIQNIRYGIPWGEGKNASGEQKMASFVNYDRYWTLEIDIDPVLDIETRISNSKQSTSFTDWLWNELEINGVRNLMGKARAAQKRMNAEWAAYLNANTDSDPETDLLQLALAAATEATLEAAQNGVKPGRTVTVTPAKTEFDKAKQAFEDAVIRRSSKEGERPEVSRKWWRNLVDISEFEIELVSNPHKLMQFVEMEWIVDAETNKGIYLIKLNMEHKFYTVLYSKLDRKAQATINLVLCSLAHVIAMPMHSRTESGITYAEMLQDWSRMLDKQLATFLKKMKLLGTDILDEDRSDDDTESTSEEAVATAATV